MTSLDCLVYLFYSLVALLWIVFAAHSAAVTYVGLFRPILRTCRKLCLWTLRGFPFVSGFLAAWLLPSPCHKCLGLVVFLATFRRLYRGPLRNLCGVLRPASEQCKPHTLTPALWTWTVLVRLLPKACYGHARDIGICLAMIAKAYCQRNKPDLCALPYTSIPEPLCLV